MSDQEDNDEEVVDIKSEDFPSNSKNSKLTKSERRIVSSLPPTKEEPQKRKVKRVVTGRIMRKKKSFTTSLAQTFFGEDTRNVGQYILWDVLIPAAKSTLQDMVGSGIEMLLYGETRGSNRRDRDRGGRSVVSYGNFYNRSGRNEPSREPRRYARVNTYNDFEEIIFERGDEAAEVLSILEDLVDNYGQATVGDLYDASGMESNFTDNKWGWKNLSRARCVRVRNGYIIDLPRPIELDD